MKIGDALQAMFGFWVAAARSRAWGRDDSRLQHEVRHSVERREKDHPEPRDVNYKFVANQDVRFSSISKFKPTAF
jgi:hypothetical protein